MPVVPHAQARELARRACVLNLSDVRAEASRIIEDARAEASRIVEEAESERARLLAGAEEEGRRAGHAEGLERGLEEGRERGRAEGVAARGPALEELQRGWMDALESFRAEREELLEGCREDVIRLGLEIASAVVKRAIEQDPGCVVEQARRGLEHVVGGGRITLVTHPDDEPLVREALADLAKTLDDGASLALEGDGSVGRGGCVVRTATGGVIDATIQRQLERLAERVLPGDGERGTGAGLRLDGGRAA